MHTPHPPEQPLAVTVADQLLDELLEGRFLPGTRLKDAPLAADFSVSRNTMRDALRLLETQGLVVSRRNAGSSVRVITEDDARDIYRIRHTLECVGVERTADVPMERLEPLRSALQSAEQAQEREDWNGLGTASLRFHQALVGVIGSDRLDGFFSRTLALLRLLFAAMADQSTYQAQWLERDQLLGRLLLTGCRSEARSELIAYLFDSEAQVIDMIRSTQYRERLRETA